ncbi:Flp pilus assembly protein CpaB [Gelria sp. Kuro-4]|uniref:Flp pilus assembly protein CpaB n=1 Tax=Gelria sp. Kuro-4 TaxID=2796927 RepID=UPI001BEF0C9A|nr:Flp pilus assembly protein CpaB [Gelria sp. Kuro-4]BCV23448.1 Flp pilus assembly protein CpaB [Gelria sp. Kuro-4]
MRNRLIFLLAIIFGLAAALGTYSYLENLKRTYRTSGHFARVAIAKREIAARTVISGEMLEFKEMPVEYVLPGTVVDVKDAAGKIAVTDIYPGELILSSKLVARSDVAAGLAAKVEKGRRAISIPVNNITALHGLINTGDRVDVLVTFNAPDEQKAPVTSTIIQNVPVLAVDGNLEGGGGSKQELQTVTIMVEPVEAQQIALAVQHGSIQLALRSPDDVEVVPVLTSRLEHLVR